MKRKHGFTLVELLVVIGIIAILISLLLPALNIVRQHAVTAKCLSNMKNIAAAAQMYSNRFNDYIVPAAYIVPAGSSGPSGAGGNNNYENWATLLVNTGCTIAPPIVNSGIDPVTGNVTGTMVVESGELNSIFYCPGSGFNAGDPVTFGPSGPQAANIPASLKDGLGNAPWRVVSANCNAQPPGAPQVDWHGTGICVDVWYGINCSPSIERTQPNAEGNPGNPGGGALLAPTRRWPSDAWPPGSGTPDLQLPRNADVQYNTTVPFIFDGLYMNFFAAGHQFRPFPRHNKYQKINILFMDYHAETLDRTILPTCEVYNGGAGYDFSWGTLVDPSKPTSKQFRWPRWRSDQGGS